MATPRDSAMRINADFAVRAAVHTDAVPWVPSPMPGVERKMLDRLSAETGRATSVVRYAPGSSFAEHVHDGGEEFFVLDGVFQDQYGDFPAGTYVRNPPTTRHSPRSEAGCTIFVKLHQFDADDRNQMDIDTHRRVPEPVAGEPGRAQIPLYEDARETVRIEVWEPAAEVTLSCAGGLELFVLAGAFEEAGERFEPRAWLRLPPAGEAVRFVAGSEGARVFVKSRHLSPMVAGRIG